MPDTLAESLEEIPAKDVATLQKPLLSQPPNGSGGSASSRRAGLAGRTSSKEKEFLNQAPSHDTDWARDWRALALTERISQQKADAHVFHKAQRRRLP